MGEDDTEDAVEMFFHISPFTSFKGGIILYICSSPGRRDLLTRLSKSDWITGRCAIHEGLNACNEYLIIKIIKIGVLFTF